MSIYISLKDFVHAYTKVSIPAVGKTSSLPSKLPTKRKTILSIDYGTKKIGLASTQGLNHPIIPQAVISPPAQVNSGK